jgi:proteasome accessory factor C
MSDVHDRLRRLLLLVPYVAAHPGIGVEALCTELSMSREELLKDLDLLTYVGRPPFQPDDYIDIYVENDRVYVDLDQRFSAPPRLTASEAAALTAAAEILRPAAHDTLRSALTKLEKVLPQGVRSRYREMEQKIDVTAPAPNELGPLTKAITEHKEVELEYFTQGTGGATRRTVRPAELFSHRGQWYLSAYCCTRQDDRLFRVDRMRGVTVTDKTFEPRGAPSRGLPNPMGHGEVRVRFSPSMASYMRERFGEDARPLADGSLEVRVSGESERWLTQWVLSFGGEATVVEPASARSAVAKAAQALLA